MKIRTRQTQRINDLSFSLPPQSHIRWFRNQILKWFDNNQRHFIWRDTDNPYEIIISELFLQQTSANKVNQVLPLFIKRFPSWEAIAKDSQHEIEDLISPLGLQRRRSSTLFALAMIMANSLELPRKRQELEKLPGIGQYIASVILVTIHGQRAPFLDVNMARVLERCFGERHLADIRADPFLQALSLKIVNTDDCRLLNWAILDFAALVCKKRNPNHKSCPLFGRCGYGKTEVT